MSEKARVRWLCRRGMKELDVLLERFVGTEYDELGERERGELLTLLGMEDPDLYGLVMQRGTPDNDVQANLVTRIRQFRQPAGTTG